MVTVLHHAKNRIRAMTVAPRVGLVGLLGQGNLGTDGSLEAELAYLDAEHPDAILDFLSTGTGQMMARYGVLTTRLRWYNTQTQRALGVTAPTAKSLMVPLGIIVDAFRIGTWVRRHDVVMVPGLGVLETSLPLRSWHTPYSFALPIPRDVSVDECVRNEGIAYFRAHRPQIGPSRTVAEPVHSVDVDRLIEQSAELESRSAQLQQMFMERTAPNVRLLNHQFATVSELLFRSGNPNRRRPRRMTSVLA
jgi:hypothetical protein